MNAPCEHEAELVAALGRGFVGPDLEAHVRECAACAELHTVASAFLDERADAIAEAPVPSSGTMWWRMRIRQRHEAAARVQRSLLVGQTTTLALALGLLLALFGGEVIAGVRELAVTVRLSTPLLIAVASLGLGAVVAPIAGWLALRQRS